MMIDYEEMTYNNPNELDEYLNKQQSSCEEHLGDLYFAITDALEEDR